MTYRFSEQDANRLRNAGLTLTATHDDTATLYVASAARPDLVVTVPLQAALESGDPVGYAIAEWTTKAQPEQTPAEQFAHAHRALEDALAELTRAHAAAAGEDDPGILVDFVIVTATHRDLGGGVSSTDHGIFGPVEGAAYRAVGLLETGRDRLRVALNTTPDQP